MKRTSLANLGVIIAASLLAAGPAMSAGNYMAMSAGHYTTMSTLPPQQMQGDVAFMSGGIGQAEAAAMRNERSAFPLSLEFVKRAPSGAQYLADVGVTIKDHMGNTVLDTVANGPFLLAKLPDGRYTVTANMDGRTKEHNVVIAGQKPERIVFEW